MNLFHFGTAGIRAPMGDAENQLNTASITRIAWAIGKFLKPRSSVVVGFDARHHSATFARIMAEVLSAFEYHIWLFDQIIPTPICAFSTTELESDIGIMITASHNPPLDNGVKVYGTDGAQIIAPNTNIIENWLEKAPPPTEIKRSSHIKTTPHSVIDAYFAQLNIMNQNDCQPKIVYTPLHGVGKNFALRALGQAGFNNIHVVESQAEPDGNFPTVRFPNPEEPGALDEAMALSDAIQADLILANDPDADRLAVCIAKQTLTGNEIGVLLANYLLENHPKPESLLLMTTFVSSRMLSKIAKYHGAHYAETKTGFANIMHEALRRKEKLLFAYEEALGYCIGEVVRDKDGISAALLFAKLFSMLQSQHKTVFEELDRLALLHGLHRNLQWSIRTTQDAAPNMEHCKGLMKQKSPVAGLSLYTGENDLRLMVRPSGTEPKIKFYAEVVSHPQTQDELEQDKRRLDAFLRELCEQKSP